MGYVMRDGVNRLRHAKGYSNMGDTFCVALSWSGYLAGTGSISGVDPRVVARCEQVVRIPMAGIKGSLNVSVAFGIAAYLLRYGRGVVVSSPLVMPRD